MMYDYFEEMAEKLGWHSFNNINSIPLNKEIEFCRSYNDDNIWTKSFTSRDEVFDFFCSSQFNYWRVAK